MEMIQSSYYKIIKNVSLESFKELGEKEALEIIIKLKSLIETQDINTIRSEFAKSISQEKKRRIISSLSKINNLRNIFKESLW